MEIAVRIVEERRLESLAGVDDCTLNESSAPFVGQTCRTGGCGQTIRGGVTWDAQETHKVWGADGEAMMSQWHFL